MIKQAGFQNFNREDAPKRPVEERIQDFQQFEGFLPEKNLVNQTKRCMDCGVPFCHAYGCPLSNRIPDWNAMIQVGKWRKALELLHATNNFPEITGRICPAPCETACTLAINQSAATIKHIELQIVEKGWAEGWIQPEFVSYKTGKRIAIIGSGPAGLAVAQQLVRNGNEVVVFEKSDKIGGLLRYGIPDFKLEKWIIDRRIEQMELEGVKFETGVEAGKDLSAQYMKRTFDAIVIATGAQVPRDLNIAGRSLNGIHFAMDFLVQQNKIIAGAEKYNGNWITAKDKNVIVIGGGDTGADCVGTARRLGAKDIYQLEFLPQPPIDRDVYNPWPVWPNIFRTGSSHEEGCQRLWSISTNAFVGKDNIQKLKCGKLEWKMSEKLGIQEFQAIPGSEFEIDADLVLLAMGFVHPEHDSLINDFNLDLNEQRNIVVDKNFMTSIPGVFAAGDCVSGASLVVRAIYQGREVASGVQKFLSVK